MKRFAIALMSDGYNDIYPSGTAAMVCLAEGKNKKEARINGSIKLLEASGFSIHKDITPNEIEEINGFHPNDLKVKKVDYEGKITNKITKEICKNIFPWNKETYFE